MRSISRPLISLLLVAGLSFSGAALAGKRHAKAAATARHHGAEAAAKAPEPAAETAAAPAASGAPPQRGPTRIDFDDRLIQGQSNKSGAVYLYERKELKTRSMIKLRESFREEIVGNVYDR